MARWLLLVAMVATSVSALAADPPLVVVPDTNEVDIDTSFTGGHLKALGAMSEPGDLIIKVIGPKQEVRLSHEIKLGPFWIEGDTVRVGGAPSLLYLFATAPITSLLPPAEREKYGLVLEDTRVVIEPKLQAHVATDWRKAFFRLKERQGLYHEYDRAIRVFGNRLYIADVRLPGDLAVGDYTVETLLVKSGKVVGHATGHFDVRLDGLERWVWRAAHDHAWLFGALFTLLAMLLGLGLNAATSRRSPSV